MLKQSYIRKTRERPNSSPKQPREQVPSAHQSHSVEIVGLIVSKGLSALPNIYESAALVKMQIAGIKGSLPCEACDGYPVGPRLLESTRSRRKHLFAYWGHD